MLRTETVVNRHHSKIARRSSLNVLRVLGTNAPRVVRTCYALSGTDVGDTFTTRPSAVRDGDRGGQAGSKEDQNQVEAQTVLYRPRQGIGGVRY